MAYLPFLQALDVAFKESVNFSTYDLYGKELFSVAKAQLLANKSLQVAFDDCCSTQDLLTTADTDMLEVYTELITKRVHTRLNDFLKGNEQLQSWEDSRDVNPELTLMLRDKLKGIVASN